MNPSPQLAEAASTAANVTNRVPSIPGDVTEVLRLATMVHSLHEQVRSMQLDESARQRLVEIYRRAVDGIAAELSPELRYELTDLVGRLDDDRPSAADLRVVQATLNGWLQGLFQGLQYEHAARVAAPSSRVPAASSSADRTLPVGQYL